MAYVCVTGNEESPAALQDRLEKVLSSHSRVLCELRLDYLDLSPAAVFGFLARLPAEMAPRLVLTQRLKASGAVAKGRCTWDVHTWQSWWKDVMALRPWFAVDLDWLVLDRLAGESLGWRGKFRSRHAFFSLHAPLREIEAQLPDLVASAREHNAGVKIACPVEGSRDLARLADLNSQLEGLPLKIAVAMGNTGRAWRWCRLAGDITYFAVESAKATAPGQEQFASVLPYLGTKQRPDLYLLLGQDPANLYGEKRWNRAFLKRGATCRYLNCATSDEPGASWAENSLHWMEMAGIEGASVTRPYKLSFPEPTNTLKRDRDNGGWDRKNTDASAVAGILLRRGISADASVVVAGGGGAARALKAGLGNPVKLWVREEEKLGPCPEGEVLVSTWPGEVQEALVRSLPRSPAFRLVLDAQFSRSPEESPLAEWCRERKIAYLPGTEWWKEQARLQDLFWFGPDRLGVAGAAVRALVPNSKSETLRAMAIALACGVPAEIEGYAQNEDTEVFLRALEPLGVSADRTEEKLRLYPPKKIRPPEAPLAMGEGATGLRMLAALSAVMSEGVLRLSGSGRLEERPSEELRQSLGALGEGWPLEIPAGGTLPSAVSLEKSSQFASAFLIAGAGLIFRGRLDEYALELQGELRSEPYLKLTLALLREAGFSADEEERRIRLYLGEKKAKLHFVIEKDTSSLAFLEAYARRWQLSSFFSHSRQGDGRFPSLLERLERGEPLSLKDTPDLAPPLWAAAALLRLRLEVTDCPQLHWKESDRAKLLAAAAKELGAIGEENDDGFLADFRGWSPPEREVFLPTGGDHRLAMAYGLLTAEWPHLMPDRKDCVRKSFPAFWQALALLEEAQP